jgi:hypothetical protein
MAHLYYGGESAPIEMPDDLMAHVKVVIATKLRRNESFMMSWHHGEGGGRTAIWIQPSIPIRFVFDTAEAPALDRELLSSLADSANSNSGLVLKADAGERAVAAPRAVPEPQSAPELEPAA